MISPQANFNEFVLAIKERTLGEIFQIITEEKEQAIRAKMAVPYVESLRGLHFLLSEMRRPSGVEDWEFAAMFPLVENLVARKELPARVLSEFA